MEKKIELLFRNWQKRNISGIYCNNKEEAANIILEAIPQQATVGISGSVTLDQLEVVKQLESRGNKVFNPYKPGLERDESLEIRRQGAQANFYLASANAVSENGELVFFSGFGNRTAGVSNAKNVIIVCGVNKITPNLEAALKRAREFATPLNCKRLNWNSACLADGICHNESCLFPEYRRMCCQVLVLEAETASGRLKVIIVGENLGY